MYLSIERTDILGLRNIRTLDIGSEGTYYLCKDILKEIGAKSKDVKVAFKNVEAKNKMKFAVEEEECSLQPRTPYLFVNYKGLVQYLSTSRKPLAKMALEKVGAFALFNGSIKLETNFGVILHKVFDGVVEFEEQKKIGEYHVDFYFKKYNIIVEYDEQHHKQQVEQDKKREDWIVEKTGAKIIRVATGFEYQGVGNILKEILKIEGQKIE